MDQNVELPAEVRGWLQDFARCVRDRTYDAARPLFHPEVYSFGTVAFTASGLDDLVARQWREVWDFTEGFDFDYGQARCWNGGGLVCIAIPWSSRGFLDDGGTFDRRGRCTVTLQRVQQDWKAVHTHFSMEPVSSLAP